MIDNLVIVQARQNSTRFPNKILEKIDSQSLITILIKRISKSKLIDKVVVATGDKKSNKSLITTLNKKNYTFFSGSENDVLDRFYKCAKKFKAKNIIRVTGDCPLVDAEIIEDLIKIFKKNKVDYASNVDPATFPDGMDVEIFKFQALKLAWEKTKNYSDREHVTPFIRRYKKNKKINLRLEKDYSNYRVTLDEKDDLKIIKKIFNKFGKNKLFNYKKVLKLIDEENYIFKNLAIKRNEGLVMGTGQKLWKRAKNVIPGGNMILSKRPEMFLPGKWPTYFSKAKGFKIWDLDGKIFKDLAYMGVGTNILGYSNNLIDHEVIKIAKIGNLTTLNAKEDVILAEKLIKLHPWSEMVRFARSGGEANSIAIRIARAASGKDNVAICGYHGWHDWYLSSNLERSSNLDEHLLPELKANGVPKKLKGTVYPFKYNDYEALKKIVETKNVGTIKMEVMRNYEPKNNFLNKVRKLASKKNIILIFDECTSGFRETNGGLHKKYKIEPDIAIFGKALGNGYAINAIIGKKNIMQAAQTTFISSTFWSERIGTSAAIKTLEVMKKNESWKIITKKGKFIKKNWKKIFENHHIDFEILGIDAIPSFRIKSKYNQMYKTYITQEMLKKNFLAANMMYLSTSHTEKAILQYLDIFNDIFYKISNLKSSDEIYNLLESEVAYSTFKRLN